MNDLLLTLINTTKHNFAIDIVCLFFIVMSNMLILTFISVLLWVYYWHMFASYKDEHGVPKREMICLVNRPIWFLKQPWNKDNSK